MERASSNSLFILSVDVLRSDGRSAYCFVRTSPHSVPSIRPDNNRGLRVASEMNGWQKLGGERRASSDCFWVVGEILIQGDGVFIGLVAAG